MFTQRRTPVSTKGDDSVSPATSSAAKSGGRSTASANRRFGFNAENELLQFLRERDGYFDGVERLHLTGKEDEGDLVIVSRLTHPVIVQLKTFAGKTAAGAERPLTPGKVKGWLRDLDSQCEAYRAHRGLSEAPGGMLVVKFKNTSWEDALVINSLGRWLG
jgi:hypothetical protein